ncbi:MAG: NAD(P)-dependent oxidoreductase [Tepidisphaerales bacterium]
MSVRPVVVITEGCAAEPLAWLKERADVRELTPDAPGFAAALAEAEALVVRTYTQVNDALLERCPRLKVVGRGGVGLENIDVAACRRRGVEVVYTPDANTRAVAEFVFGAMLRLVRPWGEFPPQGYTPLEFKQTRDTQAGRQLDELTLGVLGLGRVGRRVAQIGAVGFGMNVLFHDIAPVEVNDPLTFKAQRVDFDELLRRSDIFTLHADARPGNRHLLNARTLARLKPGAMVINTARGELLDAVALAEALRRGHVSAAAIDVFDPEPPPPDCPLLGLPNVLLTPHMAARTRTALTNMSWVVKDVWTVLSGGVPRFPAPGDGPPSHGPASGPA